MFYPGVIIGVIGFVATAIIGLSMIRNMGREQRMRTKPYKYGEDLHKRFHTKSGENIELDRQIDSFNKFEKEMAIWYSIMEKPGYWEGELNRDDLTEQEKQFLYEKNSSYFEED